MKLRMASPPCCPSESDRYRLCLREKRSSGRKCDNLLRALEACRENWRKKHHATLEHDGTRVLPPVQCRRLSCEMQACLKRTGVDEAKCALEIDKLKRCLAEFER